MADPQMAAATLEPIRMARGSRPAARAPKLARWAVTAVFAGNGATIASLAVRTPSLKIAHGLDAAHLGLLSAVFGVAAILAMQLAGGLTARWGSAWVVQSATVVLPL